MKKMIALLMALAMVLALCACGGGGTAPAGEVAASAVAEASEAAASAVAEASAAVTSESAATEASEGVASGSAATETEETEAQKDLVAVESISAVKKGSSVRVEAKIRNLSDEKKDKITVNLQGLDANGDAIFNDDLSIEDIQPGQAAKGGNSFGTDWFPLDEIVTLRMNSYEFWERTGTNSFSNSQYYDCTEYIDYTMTKNGDKYQWLPANSSAEDNGNEDDKDGAKELTPEQIDEKLQGTWEAAGDSGTFTFDSGAITVIPSDGTIMEGSYEINTEESQIDAELPVNDDQKAVIHIPYSYNDDIFSIADNRGNTLKKK